MRSIGKAGDDYIVLISGREMSELLGVYRAYNKLHKKFDYKTFSDEFDVELPIHFMANVIRIVNTTVELQGLVTSLEMMLKETVDETLR